ncbi:MAG: DUF1176 domain-containing protein [Rhodobacteraceae bacterium]|nr:DUF1176 domain-containing protein [Paracoccaceae bacterium]
MSLRVFLTVILLSASHGAQASERSFPTFGSWSVSCGNTGFCSTATFVRDQSTWLDIRLVRDWPANALPMLRIAANTPLNGEGTLRFAIDGKAVEALPITQLREFQPSVISPAGFRPIGGEGFWYPTGPSTDAMIKSMRDGLTLQVELPGADGIKTINISLIGLHQALSWMDERQAQTGTVGALAETGESPAVDAPHATSVTTVVSLPPAVMATWQNNNVCSDIDPAIFASSDAISVSLDNKTTLFILPCGTPTAHNSAYVALHLVEGSKARHVSLAQMTDLGPIATGVLYNARWNPKNLELTALFKGSGLGECGKWNRWKWVNSNFVLLEEAARPTCDGIETDVSQWPATWPVVTVGRE